MAVTPTAPQAESQDDLARAYAAQQGTQNPAAPAPTATTATSSAPMPTESQDDLAKEYAAQNGAGSTTAAPTTGSTPQETGIVPAIVRAAKNVVSMPGSIYHSIVNDPANDQEQEIMNNGVTTVGGHIPGHVALPLYRIIAQPMQDADAKAATYAQMAEHETDPKRKTALLDAAGAYRMAAKVPLVGPIAAQLAERFEYGDLQDRTSKPDPSGAMTEGLVYALAPKATSKMLGAAGDVVGSIGGKAAESLKNVSQAAGDWKRGGIVSHIYDPATDVPRPVSEVGAESAPRAVVGGMIQGIGKDTLASIGSAVGEAKEAARAVPISGTPSADFTTAMQDIAKAADRPTLESIPNDEMGRVKSMADELSTKKTLSHDEFEAYSKQLGDRIDDLENTKTDKSARRLYTQAKQALQTEYYSQLADADPKVSAALEDVNADYAEINNRLFEGPAKAMFKSAAPETMIKKLVNGSATESQVQDILKTVRELDDSDTGTDPQLPKKALGTTMEQYLKQSTLYNQMLKYGQRSQGGLLMRIDPNGMISDLDKNPAYQEIYGDDFSKIRESLVDEATRQNRLETFRNRVQAGGRVVGGAAKYGALTLAGLAGAQILTGIPIAQTLWSLVSKPKEPAPSMEQK